VELVRASSISEDKPVLSSERAPHKNKTLTLKKVKKYLVMSPRWVSTPRLID
jgi:hypothetical protein